MEFLVKYITCHFINIGGCLQSITVFSLLNNTELQYSYNWFGFKWSIRVYIYQINNAKWTRGLIVNNNPTGSIAHLSNSSKRTSKHPRVKGIQLQTIKGHLILKKEKMGFFFLNKRQGRSWL